MAVVLAVVIGASGCGPSGGAVDRPAVLRIADTGIEGMEELARAHGPFAEELARLTGREIAFFPVGDRTAAITALQFNQVDLVLAGPAEYLLMRGRLDVKPLAGVARPRYFTVFVVKTDHPARSLADLRGARIALKDPGSTTGHLAPVVMLKRAGLDPDRDVSLRMLDGARIEALVNGDVDALASGVRDYDQLIARFGEGSYRIVAESEPMPPDLWVARAGLADEVVAELRQVLLERGDALLPLLLSGSNRERYRHGASFVAVRDEDYALLREAYALLGLRVE